MGRGIPVSTGAGRNLNIEYFGAFPVLVSFAEPTLGFYVYFGVCYWCAIVSIVWNIFTVLVCIQNSV